jgi:hypothetical protein
MYNIYYKKMNNEIEHNDNQNENKIYSERDVLVLQDKKNNINAEDNNKGEMTFCINKINEGKKQSIESVIKKNNITSEINLNEKSTKLNNYAKNKTNKIISRLKIMDKNINLKSLNYILDNKHLNFKNNSCESGSIEKKIIISEHLKKNENENDDIIKESYIIDLDKLIIEDKITCIKHLIVEKNVINNFMIFLSIVNNVLFVISTCLIFLSVNVSDKNNNKIKIELTSGFSCILLGVLEKVKVICALKIKRIKKKINELHDNVNDEKYDENDID